MSRTKQEYPIEPRPLSDAEWDNYLTQLAWLEMMDEQRKLDEQEAARGE